eukprot:1766169-Prymnesium_polylepis.2
MNVQLGHAPRFDVDEEETFEVGMRQNAMDLDMFGMYNNDDTQCSSIKISFDDFKKMINVREVGKHTDEELVRRFKELEGEAGGTIRREEFVVFSLRDALQRSGERVLDIFRSWDTNFGGSVTRAEFTQALSSLGFDMLTEGEVDRLFAQFDPDQNGAV